MSEEWVTLQEGITNWRADGELPVQITSFCNTTGSTEMGALWMGKTGVSCLSLVGESPAELLFPEIF